MLRFYESKSIVEKYKKYRPRYPESIAKIALEGVDECKRRFMLDVGCGGGLSVNIFAPYFQKVLAIDPSVNQLEEARRQNQFSHVTYQEGMAENLPVDDESVDVIVTGAALHWFDRPRFYKEAHRVLKPGGRLVAFGYTSPKIIPLGLSGDFNKLTEFGTRLLRDYCVKVFDDDITREVIYQKGLDMYSDIFEEMTFKKKKNETCFIEYCWTVDDMQGFLQSLDTYDSFIAKKSDELRHLPEEKRKKKLFELDYTYDFVKELKTGWACLDTNNAEVKLKSVFSFFVILADK